jgi:hypothetical protein
MKMLMLANHEIYCYDIFVKTAIILSCLISAFFMGLYSVVMGQIKNLENFYGNIGQYSTNAVNIQSNPGHPYIPQPIKDVSQPLKNTPLQPIGN